MIYGPADLAGFDPDGPWGSRGATCSPAASTRPCTGAGPGRCASTSFPRVGRRDQRPLPLPVDPGQTGPSVAFDLPIQMGHDRLPDGRRRGRQGRGGDRLPGRHAAAVRGHPSRPGLHLHDHQRPGSLPAALYQLVGEEQGLDPAALTGTVQERRSRSTSPAAPTSTRRRRRCGSPPTCSPTAPSTCPGLPSPSPATTWPRRARPPSRRSPSPCPTPSPMCRRRWTPAWPWTSSRLGWPSSWPGRPCSRRRPSSGAARRIWADTMATRFGAKEPRSRMLRFHTQTAGVQLTAQQPLNNVVRVAVQGLAAVPAHPVAAHQRLRRGPRPAE